MEWPNKTFWLPGCQPSPLHNAWAKMPPRAHNSEWLGLSLSLSLSLSVRLSVCVCVCVSLSLSLSLSACKRLQMRGPTDELAAVASNRNMVSPEVLFGWKPGRPHEILVAVPMHHAHWCRSLRTTTTHITTVWPLRKIQLPRTRLASVPSRQ